MKLDKRIRVPLLAFYAVSSSASAAPAASVSPTPAIVRPTAAASAAGLPKVYKVPLVSPTVKAPSDESGVEFRWKASKSPLVKEYEVTLYQLNAGNAPPTLMNHVTVPAPGDRTEELAGALAAGVYTWKVEARDANGKTLAVGETRFSAVPKDYKLRALFGVDIFRTTYASAANNLASDIPSEVSGVSGSIEYGVRARWSALLDMHFFSMNFEEQNLSFMGFSAGPMYRKAFGTNKRWHWAAGMKLGYDTLPEITAITLTTFRTSKVSRMRLLPFGRIEKRIAPTAVIFSHLELNHNLSLSGGAFGPITQNETGLGYRVALGYEGTVTKSLGFDVRIDYFKDGFSYTTATDSPVIDYRGYDVRLGLTYRY